MSEKTTNIEVMVVDDHSIIRDSLVRMINLVEDMSVTASCKNGREAIASVKEKKPNIILMDAIMPGLNGVEATRAIKSIYPDIKVLMLTTFSDKELIFNAFDAGVDGYLLKDITADKLIGNIYDAISGDLIIPTEIAAKLINEIVALKSTQQAAFSRTEEEIVGLLKKGMSNKEIAEELNISYGTTRNYISDIYRKIGETDRVKAMEKLQDY